MGSHTHTSAGIEPFGGSVDFGEIEETALSFIFVQIKSGLVLVSSVERALTVKKKKAALVSLLSGRLQYFQSSRACAYWGQLLRKNLMGFRKLRRDYYCCPVTLK